MAPDRKYTHLQAEYPISCSLEKAHPNIFTVTFVRIPHTWCKQRKEKSKPCGFEDTKKSLLIFSCSLFPAKVKANSLFSREIACATSDRSKDKENKPWQFQQALSGPRGSKQRVLCQLWHTDLFSTVTSQSQDSTEPAQQTTSPQQTPSSLGWGSGWGSHMGKPQMLQSKARNVGLGFSYPWQGLELDDL